MNRISIVIFISLLAIVVSCKKPVSLPPEPKIEFDTIRTIDTIDNPELQNPVIWNEIKFRLTDGDGDIGNQAPDTLDNYNNTFVTMFRKQNGIFEEYTVTNINNDTIPLEYRLPVIPISGGVDKSLRAYVYILMEAVNLEWLPFDTLKYEVYMVDRAGHISNTIETPEVIIPRD